MRQSQLRNVPREDGREPCGKVPCGCQEVQTSQTRRQAPWSKKDFPHPEDQNFFGVEPSQAKPYKKYNQGDEDTTTTTTTTCGELCSWASRQQKGPGKTKNYPHGDDDDTIYADLGSLSSRVPKTQVQTRDMPCETDIASCGPDPCGCLSKKPPKWSKDHPCETDTASCGPNPCGCAQAKGQQFRGPQQGKTPQPWGKNHPCEEDTASCGPVSCGCQATQNRKPEQRRGFPCVTDKESCGPDPCGCTQGKGPQQTRGLQQTKTPQPWNQKYPCEGDTVSCGPVPCGCQTGQIRKPEQETDQRTDVSRRSQPWTKEFPCDTDNVSCGPDPCGCEVSNEPSAAGERGEGSQKSKSKQYPVSESGKQIPGAESGEGPQWSKSKQNYPCLQGPDPCECAGPGPWRKELGNVRKIY